MRGFKFFFFFLFLGGKGGGGAGFGFMEGGLRGWVGVTVVVLDADREGGVAVLGADFGGMRGIDLDGLVGGGVV